MTAISTIDYALMAGAAYVSTRFDVNKFPIPSGWLETRHENPQDGSGFEAISFIDGTTLSTSTEIVISYAGTYDKDWAGDIAADAGLTAGTGSAQLLQAVEYYLQVKAANPGATISLTGHSLGGGLASLVGVFFGVSATTFDQAPFAQTALFQAPNLKAYLAGKLDGSGNRIYSDAALAPLTSYIDQKEVFGVPATFIPNAGLVSNIVVQGEMLSVFPGNIPNRIGITTEDISNSATGASAGDLHSQALLTAFLQSRQTATSGQALNEVTVKLPDLLKMMFDPALFAHRTDEQNDDEHKNLIEHLVRHEVGIQGSFAADAMLSRFTRDLWKIAQDGGLSMNESNGLSSTYSNLNNVSKTLIAFAMQKYYLETTDSAKYQQELFTQITGGLQFDMADVAANLSDAKGYALYFQNYLNGQYPAFTSEERTLITAALPSLRDWYVQAGASGMDAVDTQNRGAFMLGGNGSDTLNGGTADDLLVGNAGNDQLDGGDGTDVLLGGSGNDILTGGEGADKLYGGIDNDILHGDDGAGGDLLDGGAGLDTYYADEGDTIRDSDGQGTVYFNGKHLNFATRKKGETEYTDSQGLTYTQNGSTLLVGDPLAIEGFDNGELGIYLDEEEDPAKPPKGPGYNPNNSRRWIDPLALDLDGDGKITTIASSASRAYFDFNNDGIAEKSGWIAAGDGLLALDGNGNGVVDGLGELFGTATLDGFADLKTLDSNADNQIDAEDSDYAKLKVWQDANGDGISQSSELKTLAELRIDSIGLTATPGHIADADNLIGPTASYTQRASDDGPAEMKLIADVQFAVNFALTDSNPNHALGTPPSLDADVFQLPWLRGYGNVKSLHVAYQESPALRQAASDLVALGRDGILGNFERFIAKWSGLDAAHAAYGVTRSNLTLEDKIWILENLTGQNTDKSAIEAAHFGSLFAQNSGRRQGWNDAYIEDQYQNFVQREALAFALQATSKDWLKGAYYSLNLDKFVVTDNLALQASLQSHLVAVATENDALFATAALARLKVDGADLTGLSQSLETSGYADLYLSALEFSGTDVRVQTVPGSITIQSSGGSFVEGSVGNDSFIGGTGGDVLLGRGGNDYLNGGAGNDVLDGGSGNDNLQGGTGTDTYVFGNGYGQDVISDASNIDSVQMVEGVAPADVAVTRDQYHLYLSLNGGADRLTLQNWFYGDAYKIERISFSDGAQWNAAELASRIVAAHATENADNIFGREVGEVIDGLGGNDQLYGYGGNDTLKGGSGNDTLDGGAGDDVLDGGIGNDSLQGGVGNDAYVFGNGYGLDVINDADGTAGNIDSVQMVEGVAPADVAVTRDQYHLYLSLNGGADRLTLQNWFCGDAYKIERIAFADNTAWDTVTLLAKTNVSTENADYIEGTSGDNVIDGLGGNDQILGHGGNDTLDGGSGNDSLQGGAGNDTYVFGNGYGQDVISDADWTASNLDTVQMVEGVTPADVKVSRDAGNLYLSLNGGADRLTLQNWFYGDAYKVERVAFADNTVWDTAALLAKANVATEVADYIEGTSGDNVIDGLGGNDQILGYGGNDTLDGGSGNDSLDGGNGNDTYLFGRGDGQDTLESWEWNQSKQDAVQFKAGVLPTDIVVSRNGNNLILKIAGTPDQLTVQNYFYNDGAFNPAGIESVRFADGSPAWDYAAMKAKSLIGSEGNDSLTGFNSDDTINGLGGNDQILGYGGNDTLDGGSGNDSLDSGNGNDTYLFGRGDGQDTLASWESNQNKQDVVRFKAGVLPTDIVVSQNGNNLILKIAETQDQLTIQNYFYNDGAFNPAGIESIQFADGSPAWNYATVRMKMLSGSEGNDNLGGYNTDDVIDGFGGNDSVEGRGGNDMLKGGAGDDRLYGQEGNDTLDGGSGNDSLDGGNGNDIYLFGRGEGQDTIASWESNQSKQDTVRFKADVSPVDIVASRQNDSLILKIAGTPDQLTVQNYFYNDGAFNPAGIESIQFADGSPAWDYATVRARMLAGSEGNDNLDGYNTDDVIDGLDGNDSIFGRAGNDMLKGGVGDDRLYGQEGNDTLDGGSGNDYISGGDGNDTYLFGRGDGQDALAGWESNQNKQDTVRFKADVSPADVVASRQGDNLILKIAGTPDQLTVQNYFYNDGAFNPAGIESIQFADGSPAWDYATVRARMLAGTAGNDSLVGFNSDDVIDGLDGNDSIEGRGGNDTLKGGAGDDRLYGQEGNDTLDGGSGNDYLDGSIGNDTYLFGRGDGQETIASWESNQNKQDTLQFKAGVLSADIVASRQNDSLILKIAGTQDQLTLQNYFYNDGAFNPYGLESIQFADGSPAWNYATVRAKLLIGSEGSESLLGFNSDDVIRGLGGNDQLYGNEGNDTLDGGSGNDFLEGSIGNDTYLFGRGDGQDTIAGWEENPNKQDALQFKAGVLPTDIVVSRNGNNLILKIAGTPDQLTVQNYFYNDGAFNRYGLESIQFADGSPAWDYAAVKAKLLIGSGGSDNLGGYNTDDVIDGLGGNDSIDGLGGNDTLKGGAGDDWLNGQEGNDTLDGGSGNDYMSGGDGNDTYLFGRGDGQDAIVNWEENQNKQDVVRFKAGVSPADVVASRQGDNLILKIAGTQDQLTVSNYFYNEGVFNPAGIEAIQFADGSPAWGLAEVKARLTGATEEGDNLYGFNTDDTIDGLGGNDSIEGRGGNDRLDGGFGNDTLIGGAGDDTYVFGRGSGQDVINDYRGWVGEDYDVVSFAPGISPDDLWLTQEGDDLLVQVLGGSDQLRIYGYFVDTSGSYGGGYGGGYGGSYGSTHPDVIEELRFSDGTAWHMADVRQHLAGSGSELDDSWAGTASDDFFVGRGGNDQLNGGAGDDNLHGDSGNDQLIGGSGNDVLDGGSGADVMRGEAGDDIYFVDNADDQVVEKSNNGIDTVKSIITYALGSNLEHLVLLGSSDVDGTGNSRSNLLVGNDGVNALSGGGGADQLYGAAGDDVLDGGAGVDLLVGGSGNDTYVITAGDSVVEQAGEGFDTAQSSASYILSENVEVLILTGNGSLSGTGNAGNNLIHGGGGSNRLEGGAGIDVLEGGAGADTLVDVSAEAALFNGGGGADTFSGGTGNELYLGGVGNDTLMVGTGRDVILFNLGDGKDEVLADAGASATLSLGGGIRYADLSFSKKGNDLVLKTGSKDQISFKDWYVATDHRSVTNLQVIAEAMAAFDAASSDPLLNQKVEAFDFGGLAEAFDVARTANPGLTSWALTNGLAKFHLSGSDSAALGGDLAYQYGKGGTLSGIGLTAAQQAIGNVNFGAQAQSLQPLSGLQDGLSRLA